jgi:adenine-specific DNA methylase
VLAGLLPAWTPDLADRFPDATELSDERAYHRWLLHLVGIWGDPVVARRVIAAANASGTKLKGNGYGYRQAFRNAIPREDIDLLHRVLRDTWGELPRVADPTAGGGSIPFASARFGLPTFANDLNSVAASVLKAGVQIPARNGASLTTHLERWGRRLVQRVEDELSLYFPLSNGEKVVAYLYANAVTCPRTGRLVPLLPDKWLQKEKGKEAAVVLVTEGPDREALSEPRFEVATGPMVDVRDASRGYVANGSGVSPYDNLVIDGDYIKAEAQAGRMVQILYAVAIRDSRGKRAFRAPTETDIEAIQNASDRLASVKQDWTASGLLPSEDIPDVSNYERGHRMYGVKTWLDMFTPRQALVHGTFAQEFIRIIPEVRQELGPLADDVLFALALMQGKGITHNSRGSRWDGQRSKICNIFEKHNFSFKWTFAEFEGASSLYPWCLDQLLDAYGGLASLFDESGQSLLSGAPTLERSVTVTQGSAVELVQLESGSVAHICMDPPYYDNVMYAELADFFYVWEKHTLGRIQPDFFQEVLTDKDNEAVANPARFAPMGKRKKELADLDYEAKMTAIFAESRRVLRDDGVMSVMFTHKRAEAWDTLGMGLLQAGFTVETSWPVNTEAEHSLHQASKNSAASTVMLVCRKREQAGQSMVFLDDIEAEVRLAARDAVTRYREFGIEGVDLLLSTYGPALSAISAHWPVYSSVAGIDGKARLLRPEEALQIAREEVVRLQRARIVGREVQIDNHSDFTLIAWETFKASEFPFDEARRLALAVGGLDMDALARAKVLVKKSGTVRLLPPSERIRRGGDESSTGVRIDATKFEYMNDALDTVLYVAHVDGMSDAKALMDRLGLTDDQRFLAYVQGLVNAMPRVKVKGEWIVPESGLLDTLVTAYLPDISLPAEPEVVVEIEEAPRLFD